MRELVIEVNRLLSPPDLRDAFEAYIERALVDEIDRIKAYYTEPAWSLPEGRGFELEELISPPLIHAFACYSRMMQHGWSRIVNS